MRYNDTYKKYKCYGFSSLIHSFIADIYIAPLSVGLLRSAPNPSAAEQCCLVNGAAGVSAPRNKI